ncbi:MAG TPA: LamG-like jellyroll fold domain-containing protein [Verrucomicrobiae bacterium]
MDTNASPFSVGARGYGALGYFRYSGNIAEVAYYTNILSPVDILSHFQNGTSAAPATPYVQLVQSKSPPIYLRFDEPPYYAPDPSTYPVAVNLGSSGTEDDGFYQPGAIAGLAGIPYTGITGSNYAAGFSPDAGGYIDAGFSPSLGFTTPFTVTTWFKTAPTDARFQTFIGKGDASWRAGIDGDGFARFAFGSNPDATGSSNLNDAKWHQLAGVYDATNLYLYIDGLLDATVAAPNTVSDNPNSTYIGSVPDYPGDRVFKGSMDEVALFPTALTASQIQQLYLSANVPPRITVQPPATVTIDEGASTTVGAAAFGSGTLSYQWLKNGTNLVGQITTNLTLSSVLISDTGSYSLVVTNNYGAVTSSIVAVTVQAGPPIILTSPVSLSLYTGLSATLNATAGGSAPLSYQWLMNGTNVSGATTNSLTLANLTTTQAGNYSVRVSNAEGSITSNVAILTVIPTPTSLYGMAVLADSPIAYWRLGETNGSVAYDYVGGNNGQYNSVTLGQPGYSVTDSNKAAVFGPAAPSYVGSISNINFATNSGLPSFSLEAWVKASPQSSDSSVMTKGTGAGGEQFNIDFGAGGDFRFFVRDAGGGAHLCNSLFAPDGNWHHLVGVCDSTAQMLTLYIDGISQAQAAISGTGGIKAANQAMTIGSRQSGTTAYDNQLDGSVDEVAIYATALTPEQVANHYNARYTAGALPAFVTQPVSVTNYVSLTTVLSAEAGGPDPLSYQWQSNSINIDGATATTLTISPLDLSSAANYRVIVANNSGSITSVVATLTVLVPPASLNLSSGLVLHLPFDGSYADTSGHGNNGTNVGATTFTDGKVGSGSLHYYTDTGASSYNYVSLGQRPDLSFSSNVNFSVAYWVRLPAGEYPGDLPFFCNAAGSTYSGGYTFAPSYQLGGWAWSLNGTGVYGADGSINDGNWHHLVHTFDRAGKGITYLDGNQVDARSVASVGSIDQAAQTCVGQDPTGTYGETGSADIDDIGVWRRVLTPLEAAGIYMAGVSNSVSFVSGSVPAVLTIVPVGAQLKVSWTGSGTLQAAGDLTGTFTNVPSATSPYTFSPSETRKFFRVMTP